MFLKVFDLIKIGSSLRFLLDANEKYSIHGYGMVLDNIEWLLSYFKELRFTKTLQVSSELTRIKINLESKPQSECLSSYEVLIIKKEIDIIRNTLFEETREIDVELKR